MIPTSGPYTDGTVRTEWTLALPMYSSQLGAKTGFTLGVGMSSELLRGRSAADPFTSAYFADSNVSNDVATFESTASVGVGAQVITVGGTSPFTFVWTRITGEGSMTCSGGQYPTFTYSGSTPFSAVATWNCRVTDNTGTFHDVNGLTVTLSASSDAGGP